jgi:hypothetical protein
MLSSTKTQQNGNILGLLGWGEVGAVMKRETNLYPIWRKCLSVQKRD